ncbi:MAG: hypothetical protein OEZ04_06800, partial [Nitrospinota bacterium]|nr:hypothetical protein [Nitrospinota bacterium]
MTRNIKFAVIWAVALSFFSLFSCAGPGDIPGNPTAPVKMGIKVQWPEGVTYDKNTRKLNIPASYFAPGAASAPTYLTDAEVTLVGEGMPPLKIRVDVNNAVASFSVQPGYYTVKGVVWTSIGLTFTASTQVYLQSGENGVITMTMAVNAPPGTISVTVSNATPKTGEV